MQRTSQGFSGLADAVSVRSFVRIGGHHTRVFAYLIHVCIDIVIVHVGYCFGGSGQFLQGSVSELMVESHWISIAAHESKVLGHRSGFGHVVVHLHRFGAVGHVGHRVSIVVT